MATTTVGQSQSLPSQEQASRFLAQASTGASDQDIQNLTTIGFEKWLDIQFAKPRQPGSVLKLMTANLDTTANSRSTGTDEAIWQSLISSDDTLRQRVAFALSEIFVINYANTTMVQWRGFGGAAYFDLLLDHAFGNFRNLLEAVSRNAMMGSYLTFLNNRKGNASRLPDENYAREIMQLFTIGLYQLETDGRVKQTGGKPIPTYEQADVMGLARVFTGWVLGAPGDSMDSVCKPMVQNRAWHESGEKKFLGKTIPAGTSGEESLKQALDILFRHDNVGPFICRQLIQRLVTSNPSPAYVKRVADVFNASKVNNQTVRGDLKAVIRAILLDPEARNPATSSVGPAFSGKLREPFLRFTQWARAFNASSPDGKWIIPSNAKPWDPAFGLGQSPLRSPTVFNFFRPGYVPPNTRMAANGLTAPEFQIADEVSVAGYLNFMQRMIFNTMSSITADYRAYSGLAKTPGTLVDKLSVVLAANQISSDTKSLITQAITKMKVEEDRTKTAIFMIMASPEYIALK